MWSVAWQVRPPPDARCDLHCFVETLGCPTCGGVASLDFTPPSLTKDRPLSQRQLATRQREADYENAIAKLAAGKVDVFELSEEKLAMLRASLVRVIARNERAHELRHTIKGGVAYVGLEPIPGARRPQEARLMTRSSDPLGEAGGLSGWRTRAVAQERWAGVHAPPGRYPAM